jgi:hypothetical protein
LFCRIETTSNAYAFAGTAAVAAVAVAAAGALAVCPSAIPQLINPTIQIFAIIAFAYRRIVRFDFFTASNRVIWAIFTLQPEKSS